MAIAETLILGALGGVVSATSSYLTKKGLEQIETANITKLKDTNIIGQLDNHITQQEIATTPPSTTPSTNQKFSFTEKLLSERRASNSEPQQKL